MRINLKPLSVNQAWQGRRYKTDKYKKFERDLLLLLPNIKIDFKPPYEVYFKFGFSSPLSDWDNPIKPIQDVIQKKYGINDRDIFKGIGEKEIVKKGQEYIEIEIRQYKKAS